MKSIIEIIKVDLYSRDIMVCFGNKNDLRDELNKYKIPKKDIDEMMNGIRPNTLGRSAISRIPPRRGLR